jgi:hypothetical protein
VLCSRQSSLSVQSEKCRRTICSGRTCRYEELSSALMMTATTIIRRVGQREALPESRLPLSVRIQLFLASLRLLMFACGVVLADGLALIFATRAQTLSMIGCGRRARRKTGHHATLRAALHPTLPQSTLSPAGGICRPFTSRRSSICIQRRKKCPGLLSVSLPAVADWLF